MKVINIVRRAIRSIDRATSWPVDVSVKALSKTGITRVITRAAVMNIRRDRLIVASILLFSPLLVVVLVGMVISFSVGGGYAMARAMVGVLAVAVPIYFKKKKLARHQALTRLRRCAGP
jgi:hypothetical protein